MNPQLTRKKKALLFAPLVVIPLLTLAFWAAGGGRLGAEGDPKSSGLNLSLPRAIVKGEAPRQKQQYYEEAARAVLPDQQGKQRAEDLANHMPGEGGTSFPNPLSAGEAKVYGQLSLLEKGLSNPSPVKVPLTTPAGSREKGQLDRLQAMMQGITEGRGEDREIGQLQGMMEKILDIQHPERVRATQEAGPYLVARQGEGVAIGLLGERVADSTEGRGGCEGIVAEVYQGGTVREGEMVALRLSDNVSLGEQTLPKGHILYGVVTLLNGRLHITVRTIRLQNSLHAVRLTVYDSDGQPGLPAGKGGGATLPRQTAAAGIDLVEGNGIGSMRGASLGMRAVQQWLQKKEPHKGVKLQRGYPVLLCNPLQP
jgi:hypothetical protein